jgi:outer membrane protein OmpA-like peptidoglycan-associated protein
MEKYMNFFFPCVMVFFLVSCAGSKPITYTNTSLTEKDEVMIANNSDYVRISVVGNGSYLAQVEKQNSLRKKLSERGRKLNDIQGIQIRTVESDNGNEFIAIVNNDILFTYNSFDLTSDAVNILSKLADVIRDIPETKVQIIGYTDSTGSVDYNLKLSQLRAKSVAMHLYELGIDDISEVGKGIENPVASNSTEQGRKKNRRVEIKLYTQDL